MEEEAGRMDVFKEALEPSGFSMRENPRRLNRYERKHSSVTMKRNAIITRVLNLEFQQPKRLNCNMP